VSGRNWGRARERQRAAGNTERAKYHAPMMRPLWRRTRPPPVPKDELRATADAAIAGFTGTVTRLPTMAPAKCCGCHHRITLTVPHGEPSPEWTCRKCGTVNDAGRVPN
jgi:hypothetical protein